MRVHLHNYENILTPNIFQVTVYLHCSYLVVVKYILHCCVTLLFTVLKGKLNCLFCLILLHITDCLKFTIYTDFCFSQRVKHWCLTQFYHSICHDYMLSHPIFYGSICCVHPTRDVHDRCCCIYICIYKLKSNGDGKTNNWTPLLLFHW